MTALPQPINLFEFEQFAKERLPKEEYDYIAGGATDEISVDRNHRAFASWALRPRVLRDVSSIGSVDHGAWHQSEFAGFDRALRWTQARPSRRRARHLSRRSGVRQYHGRQRQFEYVF